MEGGADGFRDAGGVEAQGGEDVVGLAVGDVVDRGGEHHAGGRLAAR